MINPIETDEVTKSYRVYSHVKMGENDLICKSGSI